MQLPSLSHPPPSQPPLPLTLPELRLGLMLLCPLVRNPQLFDVAQAQTGCLQVLQHLHGGNQGMKAEWQRLMSAAPYVRQTRHRWEPGPAASAWEARGERLWHWQQAASKDCWRHGRQCLEGMVVDAKQPESSCLPMHIPTSLHTSHPHLAAGADHLCRRKLLGLHGRPCGRLLQPGDHASHTLLQQVSYMRLRCSYAFGPEAGQASCREQRRRQ